MPTEHFEGADFAEPRLIVGARQDDGVVRDVSFGQLDGKRFVCCAEGVGRARFDVNGARTVLLDDGSEALGVGRGAMRADGRLDGSERAKRSRAAEKNLDGDKPSK